MDKLLKAKSKLKRLRRLSKENSRLKVIKEKLQYMKILIIIIFLLALSNVSRTEDYVMILYVTIAYFSLYVFVTYLGYKISGVVRFKRLCQKYNQLIEDEKILKDMYGYYDKEKINDFKGNVVKLASSITAIEQHQFSNVKEENRQLSKKERMKLAEIRDHINRLMAKIH